MSASSKTEGSSPNSLNTEFSPVKMEEKTVRTDQGGGPKVLRFDSRFLTAQHLRFYDMRVSRIAFALVHPSAVTLELVHCQWDLATQIPVSRNIPARTILLVGTRISDYGFSTILENFPNLRTLSYYRPADEIDTHFDMVGQELATSGQNLEHLTMLNENLMPFATPVGSLKKLTNLKTLEIDLELLIGFREIPNEDYDEYMDSGLVEPDTMLDYEEIHEQAGDWCLLDLLPASLEELTLHLENPKLDTYFYNYERYGAKLEELLKAEHLFPNLTCISAPRLAEVSEKIGGRQAGWSLTLSTMHRQPLPAEVEKDTSVIVAEFHDED
ncbi:hypothetical protein F4825DRAFT_473085 [Nemania diffusa]|nr:hypothetical protein F4825DRAFT_473085 [Nemania diffusa]